MRRSRWVFRIPTLMAGLAVWASTMHVDTPAASASTAGRPVASAATATEQVTYIREGFSGDANPGMLGWNDSRGAHIRYRGQARVDLGAGAEFGSFIGTTGVAVYTAHDDIYFFDPATDRHVRARMSGPRTEYDVTGSGRLLQYWVSRRSGDYLYAFDRTTRERTVLANTFVSCGECPYFWSGSVTDRFATWGEYQPGSGLFFNFTFNADGGERLIPIDDVRASVVVAGRTALIVMPDPEGGAMIQSWRLGSAKTPVTIVSGLPRLRSRVLLATGGDPEPDLIYGTVLDGARWIVRVRDVGAAPT